MKVVTRELIKNISKLAQTLYHHIYSRGALIKQALGGRVDCNETSKTGAVYTADLISNRRNMWRGYTLWNHLPTSRIQTAAPTH